MSSEIENCDVLIVGAGPVGLMLACELGARNIETIVVEQRGSLFAHPKANTHNARSMEIYRRHGISQQFRFTGLPKNRPTDVAYFSRLFGHELHRVALPSPAEAVAQVKQGDPRWPTPEPQFRSTQMALEPLLLERARSFDSVDIDFCTEIISIAAHDTGHLIKCSAGGVGRDIRARFVVGCDGGRSWVRNHLGIAFIGAAGLQMDFMGGKMLATYFRAPTLLERFPHKATWMHWIMHPEGRSILVLIDPDRHEFLMHYPLPANQPAPDFGAKLNAAIGEKLEFETLSSVEWRAGIGVVAEQYNQDTIFLAGDAAHLFTPTGGFGLNTGIEDAFNLGWKLALACRGQAGPVLLESYEAERRPIAVRNTDYALKLAQNAGTCPISPLLDQMGPDADAARAATAAHLQKFARWEFDTPGIQLGGRYDGSPVIAEESGLRAEDSPIDYTPDAAPGGRLPHIWLPDGRSIFDALGPEFTLLQLGQSAGELDWTNAASGLGLKLTIVTLDDVALRPLYGADVLLIRPDMYVAWRGDAVTNPRSVLLRATGGI